MVALLLLLLVQSASAQAPPTTLQPWIPPHGGGPCATELDCSLGGLCTAGKCVCDPWFTGSNCTLLNLQRAKPDAGFRPPGYHSWGGHAAWDEGSGRWMGLFSFMVRRCSLSAWTTNSASVLATSKEVDGPYTLLGDPEPDSIAPGNPALIVPPWSHNTFLARDPPSGEWLLWHIGSGQVPASQWKNCTGNPDDDTDQPIASMSTPGVSRQQIRASLEGSSVAPLPVLGDTFFVATAKSLVGPWNTSVNISATVNQPPGVDNATYWAWHKSNPAPFIFPNGSALVFFSSQNCPPGWPGALAPACIGMATAPHWKGPYTAVGTTPITSPESEDPSVFRDPRGNFHLLTNINNCHKHCAAGVACGGHAHSRNGLDWSELYVGAFGPVITCDWPIDCLQALIICLTHGGIVFAATSMAPYTMPHTSSGETHTPALPTHPAVPLAVASSYSMAVFCALLDSECSVPLRGTLPTNTTTGRRLCRTRAPCRWVFLSALGSVPIPTQCLGLKSFAQRS
jgi:hypothetical protein